MHMGTYSTNFAILSKGPLLVLGIFLVDHQINVLFIFIINQ